MNSPPVNALLASLKWFENIDCANLPEDLLPEDRKAKINGILADLRHLSFNTVIGEPVSVKMTRLVPAAWNEPLSDIGSDTKNTRFNYKENGEHIKCRVLYFGCSEITAYLERFQDQEIFHDPEFSPIQHVNYTYQIVLPNVLKLVSESHVGKIGVSLGALMSEWKYMNEDYALPSVSQILAHIVRERGFNGILYKSARFGAGQNLVVFTQNTPGIFATELEPSRPLDWEEINARLLNTEKNS